MELFRLLGTIAIDNSKANDEIDETTDKAAKSEGKMSASFKKIGKAVAAGFAISKIVDFGRQLVSIAEDTREYRAEMGKLEAAFTTAGHSAEVATGVYNSLYAVLGETDQSVEAANHLAMLTNNEKDLATWTDICTGVYATFGDSLPIEGLTEAANETSRTGQLTGQLADALNWAGVSEDEFQASLDACNTQQERQALITETLNGLYDDAADKYKEVNADVLAANEAQAKLEEGLAAVGAIVDPVITQFKYFAGTVLLKAVEAIKKVINVGKNLVDRFTQIKNVVAGAINSLKEFLGLDGKTSNVKTTVSTSSSKKTTSSVKKHAAGGILTKPTIFGYTPATDTYHLGGEAGAEAIAPIDVLQKYVRAAVEEANQNHSNDKIYEVLSKILYMLQSGKIAAVMDGEKMGEFVLKTVEREVYA